jgi:hypothetical protein
MSDLINISICLSDIPKDKIKQGKNGKKYLNITVARRREPDQYEQTHTVYVNQTQDERNEKSPRTYIGSGKEVIFGGAPVTAESVDSMPVATTSEDDDLPF